MALRRVEYAPLWQVKCVTIPVELIPEFEEWGRQTASLFGKLRQKAGLKPSNVPQDQAWFWSEAWQAGEREVDKQLANGEYDDFDTVEELLADLHKSV